MIKIRICEKPLHFWHDTLVFEEDNIESIRNKEHLIKGHSLGGEVEGVVTGALWGLLNQILVFLVFSAFVVFDEDAFENVGLFEGEELDGDGVGVFFFWEREGEDFLFLGLDLEVGFPEFDEIFNFLILVLGYFEDLHF